MTGQVPAGAPVRDSASPDVRSETTCRGAVPGSDTDDRVGPSSTGRRPARSIEFTAWSSSATDDAAEPGGHQRGGLPAQSPDGRRERRRRGRVHEQHARRLPDGGAQRGGGGDRAAVRGGGSPPRATAPGSTSLDTPDEYRPTDGSAVRPGFSVVTTVGIASASTQQAAAPAMAVREAPSAEARDASHDDIHTASSTSPGSTTGTSRRDAAGCHGTTAGSHSTVTTDQAVISSGSAHSRTAEKRDSGRARASLECRLHRPPPERRRPRAGEQQRGHPEVPRRPGEARLVVLAQPVDRQPLKSLQRRDRPDHGRVGLPADGLEVRPLGQPDEDRHRQHEGQPLRHPAE